MLGRHFCSVLLSNRSVLLNSRGDTFLNVVCALLISVKPNENLNMWNILGFLLNCSALSSCVFSAPPPPPSESGRRWLRSHPQQQILCFQDCQQRQFLSLLYQWQESHIQRSRGSAPQPRHRPGPQQISDLTGNADFFFSTSCSAAVCVCVCVKTDVYVELSPAWLRWTCHTGSGR